MDALIPSLMNWELSWEDNAGKRDKAVDTVFTGEDAVLPE